MGARYRICETCVYCSFAGNCDRYDKPLTSIEQPACDAYEIHPLLAENAKLRELVRKYVEYTSQDRCEGCVCKRKCNDGDVDECWQRTEIRELARELGIEVDG